MGINTITKSWVFDVYQGKGIETGRKSMSLGLILLDSSRTLTDEDVEETVTQVIDKLGIKLGASLRE
jgi:phenylalanyl-tRNA synthetase beta chain